MSTNNLRINITLDKHYAQELAQLAEHEDKSIPTLARQLIIKGLENHEDMALSAIVDKRDQKFARGIKHGDVWK